MKSFLKKDFNLEQETASDNMPTPIEKTYLEKLRKGEVAGFKWIYDRYHEKVYGYCLKLTGKQQVAEEITQDVFVRLWEKRQLIDPAYALDGLLLKFTKDFAWNYFKRLNRQRRQTSEYHTIQPTAAPSQAESDLILEDYLEIAEEAISQLPEKRQKVFNLRYRKGLDNREIAACLDISETTVRVHLYKATHFLRNYFKSHPEIPILVLSCFSTTAHLQ